MTMLRKAFLGFGMAAAMTTAAFAQQKPDEQRFTFPGSKGSVGTILNIITEKAGPLFTHPSNTASMSGKLPAGTYTVQGALDSLFWDTQMRYSFIGRMVSIFRKSDISGKWKGVVPVSPSEEYVMHMNIKEREDGFLSGTMNVASGKNPAVPKSRHMAVFSYESDLVTLEWLEGSTANKVQSPNRIKKNRSLKWTEAELPDDDLIEGDNVILVSTSGLFREMIPKKSAGRQIPRVIYFYKDNAPDIVPLKAAPRVKKLPLLRPDPVLNMAMTTEFTPDAGRDLDQTSLFLRAAIRDINDVQNDVACEDVTIYFREQGDALLSLEEERKLESVADIMKRIPDMRIEVHGYTEKRGTRQALKKLSDARAEKIETLLETMGIDKKRITIQGHGPENPATLMQRTEEERRLSRRAELRIMPMDL